MNNSLPKVTICLQSFNCAPIIKYTLDSLIKQSYPNFEILVFDDSSTDNTIKVLSEYKEKYNFFDYFQNEKEKNTTNFNQYLKRIDTYGEFFSVFHSDDIYDSDIIAKQVNFLQKFEEAVCVSTDANIIDINNNFIGHPKIPQVIKNRQLVDYNLFVKTLFSSGFFLMMPSFMYRTDLMKKNKPIFDYEKWSWCADIAFCLELVKQGNIGFINERLLNYRVSSHSNSQKLRFERTSDNSLFKILNSIIVENSDRTLGYINNLKKQKNFLLMHDRAITGVNLILQDRKINNISIFSNIFLGFSSLSNFKKFMIAFVVKVISFLPYRKFFLRKLLSLSTFYSIK